MPGRAPAPARDAATASQEQPAGTDGPAGGDRRGGGVHDHGCRQLRGWRDDPRQRRLLHELNVLAEDVRRREIVDVDVPVTINGMVMVPSSTKPWTWN